jgi:hypothetical protein
MSGRLRAASLPAIALVLVGGVLGIQLAYGGGTYAPLRPADPCSARTLTSQTQGIGGLTERLVLIGLDKAACRLGVSREALTLDLARHSKPSNAEINALRRGLLSAVTVMKDDGTLPPASELVDEALDSSGLNSFEQTLIRAIPDSVVNAALKTDDVLSHAITNLDLRTLLTNLDNQDNLNSQIQTAVTRAVAQSLADRLRDLL